MTSRVASEGPAPVRVHAELAASWDIACSLVPGELPGWSVLLAPDLEVAGRCSPTTREIVISGAQVGVDQVVTVVHERAHALAGGGHGPAWQSLMTRAIRACVNRDLREALEFDLGSYRFDRVAVVSAASDVLWNAARAAAEMTGTDVGGLFVTLPEFQALCLSLENEALQVDEEARTASLDPSEAQVSERPPPERDAAKIASRRQVRRAVNALSVQYAARRQDVFDVFPEFASLLDRLSVGLDPEPWPELDSRHFV